MCVRPFLALTALLSQPRQDMPGQATEWREIINFYFSILFSATKILSSRVLQKIHCDIMSHNNYIILEN